jgi:DNA repair protein RadC
MDTDKTRKEHNHHGHRRRSLDHFLAQGLEGRADHNILELLLFFSIPRADTNNLAHSLIARFGSLSGVFDAPFDELVKVKGIGYQSAALIKLVLAICRAYLEDKESGGVILASTADIGRYIRPKFIGRPRETVFLLCLDGRGRLLKCQQISEGTLDYAPIMVRTIVDIVVGVGASAIVLAHNHPQGFALPSDGDVGATLRLREALKPLGVRVQDHIIVAGDDFVSMRDSGYFSQGWA